MTGTEPPKGPSPKESPNSIRGASSDALGHGITIAVAIGMFLWLGDLADGALGTSPLFALLGMIVGAAAGFYRLYVHMVILQREGDEKERDPEDGA